SLPISFTAIITLIFNIIFHRLKNKFDWFVDVKRFKRHHYYTQLKAYAIVAQSEFLRQFYDLDEKPYDEYPFIEIKKTKSKVVTNLNEGTIKREEVNISDVITDRKSTRLNSSHVSISYAVFCLKKKTTNN